jgi:Flp pilus assembly protein TadD
LMLTTKNAGGNGGVKGGNIAVARSAVYLRASVFKFFLGRFKDYCARGLLAGIFSLLLAAALTGCRPPGPRALLDGQRLVERGQFTEAIERLKTATSLLSTNAEAWNYLGLAYHQAGQPNEAVDAYKKALSLDQNLVEVHYNLGCLWLEQNRPELAKGELTAYTLHRGDNAPEGWIKLGEAQLALRDLAGAEKSLNEARQFDAQNPEALNDIGVIEEQRNRPSEAAQYFSAALKTKPDYGPAILNLAIVSQLHLNNRQYALQRYQDYLALKPRPANWEAVDAVARALGQELSPTPASPSAGSRAPAPAETASQASPPRSASTGVTRTARNEPSAPSTPRPAPSGASTPVEVVQVAPEPVIRAAQDTGPGKSSPGAASSSATQTEHRGFFSRVNPVNFFRSTPKASEQPATTEHSDGGTMVAAAMPEPPPVTYPRYHYRSPGKPAGGDRSAAEKAFAEGSRAQQAGQLPEAAAAYRRATQADPGYFDPYYNLGIVSVESGNLPEALLAYETALAIEPESHDARFNFALVLKRANYPVDAANEFEKVVTKFPSDVNAHYALANLYAQLREMAKARKHYEKVLELSPAFPQASAIHQWLWANPR